MIPFDQQLRVIVSAVAFVSPGRALLTSRRGAQREVAVAGERDGFGGLALALYTDHYSLAPESPTSPARIDNAAFLAALQAANPIAPRYQDGWTVVRADASGAWLVNAAQQQRFAARNEIVPLANAIAPGLPVRLVPLRDMVTGPNGHYLIRGRECFDPQTGRQVRFYWHIAADGAAAFLRDIGARLDRRRIPFQAKVPVDPAGYARTDAGVLYLNDEDVEAAARCDRRHLSRAARSFAAGGAAVHARTRPRPRLRRKPADAGEFWPCTAAAWWRKHWSWPKSAAHAIRRRGLRSCAERLTAYGLDLDRLERNPSSRYPYRLDALFQEQAA